MNGHFGARRTLQANAEGFVFVTIVDETEINGTNDPSVVIVSRNWDVAPMYECQMGDDSKKYDTWKASMDAPDVTNMMPGGAQKGKRKPSSVRYYDLREVVPGATAQNPSTHMLINSVTSINHIGITINYNESRAELCAGLDFKFKAVNRQGRLPCLPGNVCHALRGFANPHGQLLLGRRTVHLEWSIDQFCCMYHSTRVPHRR